MTGYVYPIEAENGRVKIGHSLNPASRARAVDLHSAVPTRMIAVWPGSRADEAGLHCRFAGLRTHREWFKIEAELASFVAQVRGVGVDRIPEWDEVGEPQGQTVAERSENYRRARIREANASPDVRRRRSISAMGSSRFRRENGSPGALSYAECMAWAQAKYDACRPVPSEAAE